MTIIKRLDDVRRLWELFIPHVSPPSDVWLARWCATHADAEIERAITKTARKFSNPRVVESDELVHRYCSATIKNRIGHEQTAPVR